MKRQLKSGHARLKTKLGLPDLELSPDLAAGIRRVKSAKKLGGRLGNWLTAEEARTLWQLPDPATLRGKRDRAILALLLACGLRRYT